MKHNNSENFVEQIDDNQISVFPNPAKDVFIISTPFKKIQSVKILNLAGQIIFQINNIGENEKQIYLENIVQGVYLVQIQLENDDLQTKKIKIQ